jgi:hypothetical protein
MWPFDQLRARKYKRRYHAALIVLLGTYMPRRLTADQRRQVESEVDANMNRTPQPAAAWRKGGGPDQIAAFRAAAMQKVGIAPLAAGLSWERLFEPWSFWRIRTAWPDLRAFDMLPISVNTDYRPMHPATADARAFLRENGLDVPDSESPHDRQPERR